MLDDLTDLNENGTTNAERTPWDVNFKEEWPRVLTLACGTVDMGAYEYGDCPYDINGDRVVDLSDLTLLLGCFGINCTGAPKNCCVADLNCDVVIDISDLSLLLSHYSTGCLCLGSEGREYSMMSGPPDPLTDWLLSASPEEVLDWWFAGQPPVGGDDR